MPALDPYSRNVLDLFVACQPLWNRGGMSERRLSISRADLEVEARHRGVYLGEFFLDKFAVCESVLVQLDLDRLKTE